MDKKTFVSIILPTYNRVHLISRAIDSVIAQTYSNWELIIIDDGSTDKTEEIVGRYQKEDKRIFFYKTSLNRGVATARNLGLQKAKGDYIAFIDSDDLWFPEKLKKQVNCLNKNQNSMAVYHSFYKNRPGEIPQIKHLGEKGNIFHLLLWNNFIDMPTLMVRKEVVGEGFDTSFQTNEDWLFILTIAQDHEIAYINEALMISYETPGSISTKEVQIAKDTLRIMKLFSESFSKEPRIISAHYRHASQVLWKQKLLKESVQSYLKGFLFRFKLGRLV